MNKTLKTVLLIVAVVVVICIGAFATGKTRIPVENISFEDYKSLAEGSGFLYYGKNKNMSSLENVADNYGISIKFLDSTENKITDLKEGTLYRYENGKVTYKYTGELSGIKFIDSLAKAGIAAKSYTTVTLSEYKKLIKADGYHFMFIGRETCGYCTKFKKSIEEAMKQYNFMVYYLDTDSLKNEQEFNELIATDSYMSENEWGTPLNLLYKDGKRIDVLNGYVSAHELIHFLIDNKVVE